MITITKSQRSAGSHQRNNWSFLPTAFNALVGVVIGMAIANSLGWM